MSEADASDVAAATTTIHFEAAETHRVWLLFPSSQTSRPSNEIMTLQESVHATEMKYDAES